MRGSGIGCRCWREAMQLRVTHRSQEVNQDRLNRRRLPAPTGVLGLAHDVSQLKVDVA